MLETLPWPRHLQKVPEIACGHHEKMDGTGYPRKLTGDTMSIQARVMAIADVFEALTAADRPYKPRKKLSDSVKIMGFMVKDQHLDRELFELFLDSGIHRQYAEAHLMPDQVDDVDVPSIKALYA
jgi:HD-GYP domain-containing protein (c-di-GMP phosphodiesterase class II)